MISEIDVHGLTSEEALREVQKYIVYLSKKNINYFEIIHGYSHGDTLKKLFSKASNFHSNRVLKVLPCWNAGRTCVFLIDRR